MRNQEQRSANRELEITVIQTETHNEMRLRINGSSVFACIPFQVSEAEVELVQELYMELDGESGSKGSSYRYREIEEKLGRLLGDLLVRGADRKKPGLTLGSILESCLARLRKDAYVRLLLSFEDEALRALPWELAMWTRPLSGELVCLGCDHRFALSRLDPGQPDLTVQRLFGSDGVLSVLNVGADGSIAGRAGYDLTAGFLARLASHLPRLHAVSLHSEELKKHFQETSKVAGLRPGFDIIHWRGHGSAKLIEALMGPDDYVELTPRGLVRQMGRPFLYMMISCDSDSGTMPDDAEGVSTALLAAGAPAVLGMHQTIRQDEFTYIPILGALLFLGLPLDYSVQYLRSIFAAQNDMTGKAARNRWHKLVLRTTSTWHLDATIARREGTASAARQSLAAMTSVFDDLFGTYERTMKGAEGSIQEPVAPLHAVAHGDSKPARRDSAAALAASHAGNGASTAGTGGGGSTAEATSTPKAFTERLGDSKFFS